MVDQWRTEARIDQQEYFEQEGYWPWFRIEPGDWHTLVMKVGRKLFGPPLQPRSERNSQTGYSNEELQLIEAICEQLKKQLRFEVEGILYACIFVHVHVGEDTVRLPIFKARAESSNTIIFVDTHSRRYVSWEDWQNNEKLPAGSYCAPLDGFYEADDHGNVKLTFENSRASDASSVAASLLKAVFTATDVGGLVLPSIFPKSASFFRAASLAARGFDIGESSHELYDRAAHGQRIGLGDREARKRWLTLLGSTLGPAAEIVHNRLQTSINASQAAGKTVDPLVQRAAASAKYAGAFITTVRAAEIFYDVIEQVRKKRKLSNWKVMDEMNHS